MTLLHERHGHRLYRVILGQRSFVLKWFGDARQAHEVQVYALLETLGVRTLPVYGRTVRALLLEDLTASHDWRPAEDSDVDRGEVGAAVAQWYRTLHEAGRRLLIDSEIVPASLHREVDALDAAAILELGRLLNLVGNPVWELAADNIEVLRQAMRSLPQTLTYNDFHWTNLALSRHPGPRRDAVVYDYHLLGIGLPYSDCRNATSVLRGVARDAFWATYGDVDEREAILDAPTATLYALSVAARRPEFPAWAAPLREQVERGTLLADLYRALAAV